MRRYRLIAAPKGWPEQLEFKLVGPDGPVGIGEEFEHELSAADEITNVDSGLLEIVPSTYRVIADDAEVYEAKTGETFERGLLQENETHLIEAGLIERVEEPAPEKATPKKTTRTPRKKKEA